MQDCPGNPQNVLRQRFCFTEATCKNEPINAHGTMCHLLLSRANQENTRRDTQSSNGSDKRN